MDGPGCKVGYWSFGNSRLQKNLRIAFGKSTGHRLVVSVGRLLVGGMEMERVGGGWMEKRNLRCHSFFGGKGYNNRGIIVFFRERLS